MNSPSVTTLSDTASATSTLVADEKPPLTEHIFTETHKKIDLTLKLFARSGPAVAVLPYLHEGDNVTGIVALNASEGFSIKSISVSVSRHTTTVASIMLVGAESSLS